MMFRRSLMNIDVETAIWFLSRTQFSLYTEIRVLRISSARWIETSLIARSMTEAFLSLIDAVSLDE